jgi:hypothetical protein
LPNILYVRWQDHYILPLSSRARRSSVSPDTIAVQNIRRDIFSSTPSAAGQQRRPEPNVPARSKGSLTCRSFVQLLLQAVQLLLELHDAGHLTVTHGRGGVGLLLGNLAGRLARHWVGVG